jgi:general stress protein YciG
MTKMKNDAVTKYLASIGRKGGMARGEKYDKKTLSEWGKKGGRPPKRGAKGEGKREESKRRV